MGKDSVLSLKSSINSEIKNVHSNQSNLSSLKRDILSAMNDRVGVSASESIESITGNYILYYESGYKKLFESVDKLEQGYNIINHSLNESNEIVKQAEIMVKELESYE